jgi:hypothetical protein
MSVLDQINEMLSPHASRLNQSIASIGIMLHQKLNDINESVKESSVSGWDDKWLRINFNKKIAAGEIEIPITTGAGAECPPNEIWAIQCIVADGAEAKSPEFTINIDQTVLVATIIKEGIGIETISGNIVMLPGETLFIDPSAEGTFTFTLHIIRRKIPDKPSPAQTGRSNEKIDARNVHDPARDIILSATGGYTEIPGETLDPAGV